MPRFNEKEKAIIQEKLFSEGEKLFIKYGIKKVTIDDLVKAAGIAKGSFYAFCPSKEQLFLEIVFSNQNKMHDEIDNFIQKNKKLPPRELIKQAFIWILEQTEQYPIFRMMDSETTEYLVRKVPRDVLESHTHDDSAALLKFEQYGVRFSYDIQKVAKILQTMSMCYFNPTQDDKDERLATMNIIINGVLKEIVEDD